MTANFDAIVQFVLIAIGSAVLAAIVALNLILGSCLLGSCIIHYEAGKGVVFAMTVFPKIDGGKT